MIGSTIWIFDINRRVYPKREAGRMGGGPIWREHWRPETVTGETSRSWITNLGSKVPKKGADPRAIAFNEEDINRASYVQENRWRIADAVRSVSDHDTLRKIADLIGYTPPSERAE